MSDLSPAKQRIVDNTMDVMLSLPWTDRPDIYWAIRFNGIFCCECGYGSRENPNPNCQCENDE